jgi:rod shape-determining protein MreC
MKSTKFSKFLIFAMTVAILLFSLLFFVNRSNDWRKRAFAVPQTAVSFLSGAIRVPYDLSVDLVNQFQDLFNTYQENQVLKQKLQSINNQSDLINDLELENESLRQQLKIEEEFKPSQSIQAKLLSRSPVSWLEFAQIDKGSTDGVSEKMLLLSTDGVLGVVNQVSTYSSQVELLTNSYNNSNLAVKFKHDKETVYGILIGFDAEKNVAIIGQLNKQVSVDAGTQVYTSALDGYSKENLPVGTVVSTEKDKDQSVLVYLSLSANLENGRGLSLVGR